MSTPPSNRFGSIKIRLTILCAKNLAKKEFFRLPDPFAKISVDESGQCYSTDICRATLDPKWNQHYDLYLGKGDGISISIWNRRKVSKKACSGFLGCVKLNTSTIQRLKDTGWQRLELSRGGSTDSDPIRGQIVVSLMSRDGRGCGSHNAVVDTHGNLSSPDDLPEGWEERRTTSGRIYYVNHVSRTTHWERPTQPANSVVEDEDPSMDRAAFPQFGNIVLMNPSASPAHDKEPTSSPITSPTRRENRENRRSRIVNDVPSDLPNGAADTSNTSSNSERREHRRPEDAPRRRSARHRQYLERNQLHQSIELPPGYEMRATTQGQVYYYNMHLGTSTWHDPRIPRDLGAVNPEDLGQLPPGWEIRRTPSSRPYFLNHTRRTTQFSDPRLSNRNILNKIMRSRGDDKSTPSMLPAIGAPSMSLNISEGPPQFSPTQEDIAMPDLAPRLPPMPEVQPMEHSSSLPVQTVSRSSTISTINQVSVVTGNSVVNGTTSNVPNLLPPPLPLPIPLGPIPAVEANTSSQVTTGNMRESPIIVDEECLPKYSRDLVTKLKALRAELNCMLPHGGHCRLDIPRKEIFEESFKQIAKLKPKDMRKRLMVKFRGEEGLDYGGVAREWLYLLSHEMLNPYYGLFQYSREDIYTLQINPDSSINPEHLSYFHFVGRVIGIAIFHGHYIDGGFTMPFYKMFLNKQILLSDIEAVDPDLHRSLNWILENDITGVMDLNFVVEHDSFGDLQMKELKPGGASLPVTEENKKDYVRLYVHHRFMQGIERQFAALQKGFDEVVPQHLLLQFDERELELVIGGLGRIDLDDWKKNTRLKHCNPETPVVGWFWGIVDSYTEEMRARLLQFVTGSSRVPLQGFKALQGSTGAAGPRLFTIHVVDAPPENLPKAHTCFNRIDLPQYKSYEAMYEKLTQAVEETCGFAVE